MEEKSKKESARWSKVLTREQEKKLADALEEIYQDALPGRIRDIEKDIHEIWWVVTCQY